MSHLRVAFYITLFDFYLVGAFFPQIRRKSPTGDKNYLAAPLQPIPPGNISEAGVITFTAPSQYLRCSLHFPLSYVRRCRSTYPPSPFEWLPFRSSRKASGLFRGSGKKAITSTSSVQVRPVSVPEPSATPHNPVRRAASAVRTRPPCSHSLAPATALRYSRALVPGGDSAFLVPPYTRSIRPKKW